MRLRSARLRDRVRDRLEERLARLAPEVVEALVGREQAVDRPDVDDRAAARRGPSRRRSPGTGRRRPSTLTWTTRSSASSGTSSNGPTSEAGASGGASIAAALTSRCGTPQSTSTSASAASTRLAVGHVAGVRADRPLVEAGAQAGGAGAWLGREVEDRDAHAPRGERDGELRAELPHPARDDGDAAGEVEQRVVHGAIVVGPGTGNSPGRSHCAVIAFPAGPDVGCAAWAARVATSPSARGGGRPRAPRLRSRAAWCCRSSIGRSTRSRCFASCSPWPGSASCAPSSDLGDAGRPAAVLALSSRTATIALGGFVGVVGRELVRTDARVTLPTVFADEFIYMTLAKSLSRGDGPGRPRRGDARVRHRVPRAADPGVRARRRRRAGIRRRPGARTPSSWRAPPCRHTCSARLVLERCRRPARRRSPVATPLLAYSGYVPRRSRSSIPASLWTAYAVARALARRRRAPQIVALAALVGVCTVRPQAIVLLPGAATAIASSLLRRGADVASWPRYRILLAGLGAAALLAPRGPPVSDTSPSARTTSSCPGLTRRATALGRPRARPGSAWRLA